MRSFTSSSVRDCKPDAILAVTVAVVEHEPSAIVLDDGRMLHHLGVPTLGGQGDASRLVATSPAQAILRRGIADAIARAAVEAEPGPIAGAILDDPGPGDVLFIRRCVVDGNNSG